MLSLIFLTSVLFMNGIHTQDVVTDPDFDTDVRIARLMSHHPCRLDRDCLPHSFCIGNDATNTGFCRCEDGWIISRNRTTYECLWPAETVNSTCTRDLECTYTLGNPSACVEGFCQCNEGAHLAPNNQCYTISRPGEICNVDFNCLLSDGSIGTCHIGRCRCPPRHHHTSDGRCVPTSRLGENCTTDDNCRHTFANCIGVCRCLPGYVISENGWRCLQAATEFTDTCDELAQCSTYLSGSFCQNNTCTCNPGSHPLGPRCWRSAIVGGRCDDRRNCYMHSGADDAVAVDCVDGRCRCNEGFENVRGVCSAPGGATVNKMYFIYVILANVLSIFVWIR
ncbi:ecdysone-inducible e1 isoform a [Holotrichia oblita]|uniref:Ecdysone-inducible e1 isoform a n=1 Tax=Holotrichia oblita TaxID=644536 RepID=A0ACB9STI3_HOLOL|nr:ecdysone-inducible e1 isoform a [Holotrichia oblita]